MSCRAGPKPGRRRKYSNHAIETAVRIGLVYHLPSRQTEGFLKSLFSLLELNADVPLVEEGVRVPYGVARASEEPSEEDSVFILAVSD